MRHEHALTGVRVDGAFGPVGCGRLSAAVYRRVVKEKVLRFDGLLARGVWYCLWGHWVTRVQRAQKVLPAFGRRVQRVWWRLAPQI